MIELRKEVMEKLRDVNQAWVDAVKDAEAKGEGLDVTDISGKVIGKIVELDQKFNEATVRLYKDNPKAVSGLFGGKQK